LREGEKDRAIFITLGVWSDCLKLGGADTAVPKVRLTSAEETGRPIDDEASRPVLVTFATGEAFIVQLEGQVKGAAVGNEAATATLDAAADQGFDC
jgi:hypothetical protein